MLNNVDYLTAPCVMIVAGVLNGALISEEELVPNDWNGVAITISHPSDAIGNAISARAPQVLASSGVGHVYHVRLGSGTRGSQKVASLVGELWLDVGRMQAMGGEALEALTMLEAHTPVECSTGFYSTSIAARGSFLGTQYVERHTQLRPDHLALLPNAIGACSLTDGCGALKSNTACTCGDTCSACQGDLPMDAPSPTRLHALWTMLSRFFAHDPAHPDEALATEQAHCPECGGLLPEGEAGDTVTCPKCGHVVTMADVRHAEPEPPEDAPEQAPESEDDEETETRPSPETEENAMPTDAIKRRVDALIANERSGWTEADRAELEQCSEVHLLRLDQQPKEPPTRKAQTPEELITESYSEPTVQQTMMAVLKDYRKRHAAAMDVLLNLQKRPKSLTEERMQTMDAEELEEYIVMAGADVPLRPGTQPLRDYSGRGGPARREMSDEETVPPAPRTLQKVVELQRARGLIA